MMFLINEFTTYYYDQLSSYLQVNAGLLKTQIGNKKKYSTETSLIETTDTIMKATKKTMITAAVFLDMSKAFDSVNREMIILRCRILAPPVLLFSGFVPILATGDKWCELTEHYLCS